MNLPGVVKSALTPGSIPFFVLCLLVWLGLRLIGPRARRLARWWIWTVSGVYLVLALPIVATSIAGHLPAVDAATLSADRPAHTIIVLDGDNRVGRVAETLRAWRANAVGNVLVLGDAWIFDDLAAAGVSADRLSRVQGPGTTRGQVEWVRNWMASHPGDRTALIASRLQMPRIAALVRSAGIAPLLLPSPIDDEPPTRGAWRFVPTYIGLRTSRDALYEHAALVYYRRKGWID